MEGTLARDHHIVNVWVEFFTVPLPMMLLIM